MVLYGTLTWQHWQALRLSDANTLATAVGAGTPLVPIIPLTVLSSNCAFAATGNVQQHLRSGPSPSHRSQCRSPSPHKPNRAANQKPKDSRSFWQLPAPGTWRFMGSYKWGYKSPNMGYNYGYPNYNPLITTHEPPSTLMPPTVSRLTRMASCLE